MTEQEFFRDIGAKIKTLRKKANMTQKEVAEKAEVYQTDLSSLENGVDKIKSIDRLRRIVEATGHNMIDLFSTV